MVVWQHLLTICGRAADTWEHVIPISRGGDGLAFNKKPACLQCNTLKGNFTLPFSLPTKQVGLAPYLWWACCTYPEWNAKYHRGGL